ncbi:MAG: aminotransferase class I/II-fold pyridoxal phosphate-dependent enzyme [bacterium]
MFLINAIKKYSRKRKALFTTPGHHQGKVAPPSVKNLLGKNIFLADLSEIEGLDNLQNPENTILKSQQHAAQVYGARDTFYLINGSSSGILALFLATLKRGDKVLIARNAHKSVINALILTGANPVWYNTDWDSKWDMPTFPNEIKNQIEANPDIKMVFITNPTYYGIIIDIKPIAEICKEKNVILAVDEAHGALWNYSEQFPESSILNGADVCVQSLHKTACSLTPSALLHLSKESKIQAEAIQKSLNLINTTSPSYPILASIEGCINYLTTPSAKLKIEELIKNIKLLKSELEETGEYEFLEDTENFKVDPTRIFAKLKGVNGHDLDDYLQNKTPVEVELSNNSGILAITGIGTDKVMLNQLKAALLKAAKKLPKTNQVNNFRTQLLNPKTIMTPQEAFNAKSREIDINEAQGMVSAESIVKYPPGVPVLIAGEEITAEHIAIIGNNTKIKVIEL